MSFAQDSIVRVCGSQRFVGYTSSVQIGSVDHIKIDQYSKHGFVLRVNHPGKSNLKVFLANNVKVIQVEGETNCRGLGSADVVDLELI